MQGWSTAGRLGALGTMLILGVPLGSATALASKTRAVAAVGRDHHVASGPAPGGVHFEARGERHLAALSVSFHGHGGGLKQAVYWSRKGRKGPMHYASAAVSYGGISCVPYAREVSGIEIKGNAYAWWDEAAGTYARGSAPEPGSVLNFRSHPTMPLGHVAVVSAIVSGREIEVDHANWWGPGASKSGVNHNVSVIDVSPNNDWTEVRVSLGRPGEYGTIYPTYGFIYARRDDGTTRMAARPHRPIDEVAEAPAGLEIRGWTLDAPDRRIK